MKKYMTQRGLEAAGKMYEYDSRKSSPGAWDWWNDNGTFGLVIPTLAAMTQLNYSASIRDIVVQWALSSDPEAFIDTILEIDPEAVIRAARKIDLRQNPKILGPVKEWIKHAPSDDRSEHLIRLLPSAVADYVSGRGNKKYLLDMLCSFDLADVRGKSIVADFSVAHVWALNLGDMSQGLDADRAAESLELLMGAGANINDEATLFLSDGTERRFNSCLEWMCFNLDDDDGDNYSSVISTLLYSGARWEEIDQQMYPKSWKVIQKHPVVMAKKKRGVLNQIASDITDHPLPGKASVPSPGFENQSARERQDKDSFIRHNTSPQKRNSVPVASSWLTGRKQRPFI